MVIVVNQEKGEKLEIAPKDNLKRLTWDQTKNVLRDLGNGWRLPTRDEMEIIYQELHLKGEGNFKNKNNKDYYWTSSKSPDDFLLTFAFFDGRSYMGMESMLNFMRAVRKK